jgi:hypothetical protein
MNRNKLDRRSERGSATIKFLAVFAVLLVIANAGFNYVPVAYDGENFKQEMQTAVVNAMALPPNVKPIESVKARIQKAAADNDVPPDMVLDVKISGQTLVAHASYTKPVSILPFGAYTYNYEFDHTAQPVGYLIKDSKYSN